VKIKPRFISGPPGTGKTHTFIVEKYKDLIKEYHPENIIIISHTNVAVREIKTAILALEEVKAKGYDNKFYEHRICTIHHYCKSKLMRKEVFDIDDHKNLISINRRFALDKRPIDKHEFYRLIKIARGQQLTPLEYWKKERPKLDIYDIKEILELEAIYTKYKNANYKFDYQDMIDEFRNRAVDPQIDVLIVDEAQDSNVTQMDAINKMAKNTKNNHFYLIGDADQTIFEFAGSDAKYFHELSKNPYLELKEGKRCSEAINNICRKIIKPIWTRYGYSRVWTPAVYTERHNKGNIGETIEGNGFYLPSLESGSSSLDILLRKIDQTNETFLFTYRGTPSDERCTNFFKIHGLEYASVEFGAHVSKKELRCYYQWPLFVEGKPMSLSQIKDFWDYLGTQVICRGKKDKSVFQGWIEKTYTIDYLVNMKLIREEYKKYKDLDRAIPPAEAKKEKIIDIKRILNTNYDFEKEIQIYHGNIHQIKGTTFSNVIVDHTRVRREPYFRQLRLTYTAYSRGIYDYWQLGRDPRSKFTLGEKDNV
jgi:hypothetical protein